MQQRCDNAKCDPVTQVIVPTMWFWRKNVIKIRFWANLAEKRKILQTMNLVNHRHRHWSSRRQRRKQQKHRKHRHRHKRNTIHHLRMRMTTTPYYCQQVIHFIFPQSFCNFTDFFVCLFLPQTKRRSKRVEFSEYKNVARLDHEKVWHHTSAGFISISRYGKGIDRIKSCRLLGLCCYKKRWQHPCQAHCSYDSQCNWTMHESTAAR